MAWLPDGEKNFEDIFIHFGATHERDRQTEKRTDRWTDRHRVPAIAVLMHSIARQKPNGQKIHHHLCRLSMHESRADISAKIKHMLSRHVHCTVCKIIQQWLQQVTNSSTSADTVATVCCSSAHVLAVRVLLFFQYLAYRCKTYTERAISH